MASARLIDAEAGGASPRLGGRAWAFLVASWMIATSATLGALFVGEVLGREPCSLCWYQRAFMFPLAVILGVASYHGDGRVGRYALPLVGLGGAVAAYHCLLYMGLISEPLRPCLARVPCSGPNMMIFGLPLPLLSFGAFATIGGLLGLCSQGDRE